MCSDMRRIERWIGYRLPIRSRILRIILWDLAFVLTLMLPYLALVSAGSWLLILVALVAPVVIMVSWARFRGVPLADG